MYFAGHLSGDIYTLSAKSKSELIRLLGKGIYYVLPNLSRLNFRPQAAYGLEAPMAQIAASVAYGTAYAVALVTIAIALFSRRDFR
jgi:hypothetical protein